MILLANSLIDGFLRSNAIGQGIVVMQLIGSVAMVAAIIGKWQELSYVARVTRRFVHDFTAGANVLEYYFKRRPSARSGLEGIYRATAERLITLITPDMHSAIAGHDPSAGVSTVLTAREIELVRSTCEHEVDEQELRVEHGMGVIATVVALAPMFGLLGTVWGVLDAFAEMGTAGTANLATIAPSISSALVTTVVGLLIAIPGVVAYNRMTATIRGIDSDMEGFAEELNGRIACEYQLQGRGV